MTSVIGSTPDATAPPADVSAAGSAPAASPGEPPLHESPGPEASPLPSWSRRLQVWRSPDDQPRWARPALLVVAALAALAYSWRIGSSIELFYAASVRSMSQNWHNFVFGAFDPAGTITIDKLPGALWVQALSVRLFGFNVWSLILPQALEGALTVLVLYHLVRRLAGPPAAIIAAVVLAASPATVLLNRGNIPDTLMILLLVLAADSTVTAIVTGRWRSIVMVGVWVALAFQAKMIEAWLVLPALGLAYLLAGRGDIWARIVRIVTMGVTAGVLSLSYITFVTLTPASQRPYVDGSTNNSIFHQVFSYNGFSRVGKASPNLVVQHTLATTILGASQPGPTVHRLLTSYYGRDTGWLLPAAAVAFVAIMWARGRRPRTDLLRAGAVLWGAWLGVLALSFTFSTTMNSYYSGALSPAVAALLGIAGVVAWERRREPITVLITAGTALMTVLYAYKLLPKGSSTGLPKGLGVLAVLLGLAAVALLLVSLWRRGSRAKPGDIAAAGFVLAGVAILLVPAVASASAVIKRLGPFDTPFEETAATAVVQHMFGPQSSPPGLAKLEAARRGAPFLMAAQTSYVSSPYIYATGEEVLPLGGFTGVFPSPSASSTRAMIAAGDFHTALIATPHSSPGAAYIAQHCLRVQSQPGTKSGPLSSLKIYYCTPGDAGG